MKNKIIVLIIAVLFIGLMVFASIFVNKYSLTFFGENISGDDKNNNLSNVSVINGDKTNTKDTTDINNDESVNIEQNLVSSDEINKEEEKEMGIINLTNENFEEEVLKSDKTVLIDFYADWCMPCKMMSPVVEKIASENENLKVGKINIDVEEELAIKYRVMSIPTFIVIKDGEEVNRIVGAVDKAELENIIM